jgi:uncharacterized membrane protein YedE/YeeE
MVTGISCDFHNMRIAWISEATQWWSPMAIAVIFGLAIATVLTLVVIPTLYSLIYTASRASGKGIESIRRAYWAPFYRITGIDSEKGKRD